MATVETTAPTGVNKLYFAAWRWHFYAGLYVIPFLLMLATTGALMIWFTAVSSEYGEMQTIAAGEKTLTVADQIAAAQAVYPGAVVDKYITPYSATTPALLRVQAEPALMLAMNPYTGEILTTRPEAGTWNEWLTNLHGEILIGGNGGWGDLLIEIAASLGMLMVATGLYLAWPRGDRGFRDMLVPNLSAKGRAFWKSLHLSMGTWTSLVLVFFLLSGLSWAGIWGGKFVQPWSTFPAEKWDAVPLSDDTHASMNHTAREEVPWVLELTPLPESGSQAGVQLLPEGTPVTFDGVLAGARALGFAARVQIVAPPGATGVWSLSRDSMSYDSTDPTADRTVHIDQYTGKVLADVRYADYPVMGKAMAVGIALHEGQMGWWNIALNWTFCALIVSMCAAGLVLWWKRRPAGALRLAAPPVPADVPLVKGVVLIALVLSLAFPVLGLTLLAVLAFDLLILSPIPALKRLLS
jgi:uncharacterized iron-regulated membrane protein